jgi:hypothetical protein
MNSARVLFGHQGGGAQASAGCYHMLKTQESFCVDRCWRIGVMSRIIPEGDAVVIVVNCLRKNP